MIKIGLDAGHGLNTAGKQTPTAIKEWSLNDKVRDKVVSNLMEYDVEFVHTDNDEGTVDESLTSRVNKYINAGVAAVVSLHHNAFIGEWNSATGVEVWVDPNATDDDLRLAECVYKRLVEYTGLRGRGIKRSDFTIINQNRVPAILCEGGFMDGSEDYKIITSEEGQEAYARAVSEGLIEFLELEKSTPAKPAEPIKPTVVDGVKANDTVSIADNAVYYDGGEIPGWVKDKNWIVKEVVNSRAVIDKSEDGKNSINSAVDVKYLTVVNKTTPAKPAEPIKPTVVDGVKANDTVSIADNAVYYDGGEIPGWVKDKNWIVKEVVNSRAVIDKSEDGKNSINSAVDVKYLTVVNSSVVEKESVPFKVSVDIKDLNIRTGAGTNYAKTGHCTGNGVFTIVEVKEGPGSDKGWGKLKSGAGWISLDFANKL